jgi:hypothetical protein
MKLFRPLLACLLLLALSGCFKANFVSVVDKKGNVVSQAEIATSILFADNLNKIVQDLRAKGYEVSVGVRKDGMMAATWQQKGFPLEGTWSCGWFGGDCTYALREKFDVSAQDQALMGTLRNDPDTAKMAPEFRMLVVLPHNSKVKSSDAAKVVENADGVNLLWSLDPYRTGLIKANFTAKLGDGQKSSTSPLEEKKAPSVSMSLPDPPRQVAVPERREPLSSVSQSPPRESQQAQPQRKSQGLHIPFSEDDILREKENVKESGYITIYVDKKEDASPGDLAGRGGCLPFFVIENTTDNTVKPLISFAAHDRKYKFISTVAPIFMPVRPGKKDEAFLNAGIPGVPCSEVGYLKYKDVITCEINGDYVNEARCLKTIRFRTKEIIITDTSP